MVKIEGLLFRVVLVVVLLFVPACSNDYNYEPPAGSNETAITHVSFGNMTIDGNKKMGDVSIRPGGKVATWLFDNDTHVITVDNLSSMVSEKIKILIIGLGYNSAADLDEKAKEYVEQLKKSGIEVHSLPTREAAEKFNALPKKEMAAIFHLNC